KIELFREAKLIADRIPSLADRLDRYDWIAEAAADGNRGFSEQCILDAVKAMSTSDDPELAPIQKRLTDLAYRISPEFASKLIASLDDDEARIKVRKTVKERTALNELKQT